MPKDYPVNPNLALVSLDELQKEIFNRCENCLIVTNMVVDCGHPEVLVSYDGGALGAIGLAEVAAERLRKSIFEDDAGI